MKRYLYCHTSNWAFTKGKPYEIIEEKHSYFVVHNDNNDRHILTKERDWEGETYRDFMTLDLPDNGGINAPTMTTKQQVLLEELQKVIQKIDNTCGDWEWHYCPNGTPQRYISDLLAQYRWTSKDIGGK